MRVCIRGLQHQRRVLNAPPGAPHPSQEPQSHLRPKMTLASDIKPAVPARWMSNISRVSQNFVLCPAWRHDRMQSALDAKPDRRAHPNRFTEHVSSSTFLGSGGLHVFAKRMFSEENNDCVDSAKPCRATTIVSEPRYPSTLNSLKQHLNSIHSA